MYRPSTKKIGNVRREIQINIYVIVEKPVTSALDRNKIPNRESVRLIIPIVAALAYDPVSTPVSRSSIKRK